MRRVWSIMRKDLRAYYLKPPLITWAIVMPLVLILAFYLRNPQDIVGILPGLIGMTVLFGATSMEGIAFTFEKRVGALERLFLAPITVRQIVLAKVLSGAAFGILTGSVVLVGGNLVFEEVAPHWPLAMVALVLTSLAMASLGMVVAVSVKEVFEAMTLFNFFRFPMVFLCGVFLPVASMVLPLRIIAYALPLTYAVDALRRFILPDADAPLLPPALSLLILATFSVTLLFAAELALKRRLRKDY